MEWNVYVENNGKIEVRNVFELSGAFDKGLKELTKKEYAFEDFKEALKRETMYAYWSKCEYETCITDVFCSVDYAEIRRLNEESEKRARYKYDVDLKVCKKIDVYEQLALNWDKFVEYVWRNLYNKQVAL